MSNNQDRPQVTDNLGLVKAMDRLGLENPLMEINGNWDIIDNILGDLVSNANTGDDTPSTLENNLSQLKINLEGR